jgi:hypothetical protein
MVCWVTAIPIAVKLNPHTPPVQLRFWQSVSGPGHWVGLVQGGVPPVPDEVVDAVEPDADVEADVDEVDVDVEPPVDPFDPEEPAPPAPPVSSRFDP